MASNPRDKIYQMLKRYPGQTMEELQKRGRSIHNSVIEAEIERLLPLGYVIQKGDLYYWRAHPRKAAKKKAKQEATLKQIVKEITDPTPLRDAFLVDLMEYINLNPHVTHNAINDEFLHRFTRKQTTASLYYLCKQGRIVKNTAHRLHPTYLVPLTKGLDTRWPVRSVSTECGYYR